MKLTHLVLPVLTAISLGILTPQAKACTNLIVTPAASADGSMICTYNADDYGMFGDLCHYPAAHHPAGQMRDIISWETHKLMGQIPEAEVTYNVIGNINEHQVTIAETTYGGREEMIDTTGLLDYGSLIYLALQRAQSARQAISVITSLAEQYGYNSSGETFSICDPNEAWIMELMGCGPNSKAIVWVAVRIPNGNICAHANQSRIGNWNKLGLKPSDILTSKNVISFARSKGWFQGKDKDFSWKDTYAKPDFEGRRFCDARVWSFFNHHANMQSYLPWALGRDTTAADLPLWIVPDHKLSLHDVMMDMRDHYEGTPLSLVDSTSLTGGPWLMPYRPTPLTFHHSANATDGPNYFWERPISTQQTAFTFVSQMRPNKPNHLGGILWFGNDDANMIAYTPIYCSMTQQPECYTPCHGANAVTFSPDNAFWLCNFVSNMVYPRYAALFPELQQIRDSLESKFINQQQQIDQLTSTLPTKDAINLLTAHSHQCANIMMQAWKTLANTIIVGYNDMAVKHRTPQGTFQTTPEGIVHPVRRTGYPDPTRHTQIKSQSLQSE